MFYPLGAKSCSGVGAAKMTTPTPFIESTGHPPTEEDRPPQLPS